MAQPRLLTDEELDSMGAPNPAAPPRSGGLLTDEQMDALPGTNAPAQWAPPQVSTEAPGIFTGIGRVAAQAWRASTAAQAFKALIEARKKVPALPSAGMTSNLRYAYAPAELKAATQAMARQQEIPTPPELVEFGQGGGVQALETLGRHPIKIPAYIGTQGFVSSLRPLAYGGIGQVVGGGLGFAVAGPPGARVGQMIGAGAGVGKGSYAVEYRSQLLDAAVKAGVDFSSPEALAASLQDPAKIEAWQAQARAKARVVAGFDAVTGAVTFGIGQTLGRKILSTIGRRVAGQIGTKALFSALIGSAVSRFLGAAAIEGTLGGAGEYLGQKAAGLQTSWPDVWAEVIGEFGMGAPHAALGTIGEIAPAGYRAWQRAGAAPAPPGQVPPIVVPGRRPAAARPPPLPTPPVAAPGATATIQPSLPTVAPAATAAPSPTAAERQEAKAQRRMLLSPRQGETVFGPDGEVDVLEVSDDGKQAIVTLLSTGEERQYPTQTLWVRKKVPSGQAQVPTTSPIPAQQGEPALPGREVPAQGGAAQRGGGYPETAQAQPAPAEVVLEQPQIVQRLRSMLGLPRQAPGMSPLSIGIQGITRAPRAGRAAAVFSVLTQVNPRQSEAAAALRADEITRWLDEVERAWQAGRQPEAAAAAAPQVLLGAGVPADRTAPEARANSVLADLAGSLGMLTAENDVSPEDRQSLNAILAEVDPATRQNRIAQVLMARGVEADRAMRQAAAMNEALLEQERADPEAFNQGRMWATALENIRQQGVPVVSVEVDATPPPQVDAGETPFAGTIAYPDPHRRGVVRVVLSELNQLLELFPPNWRVTLLQAILSEEALHSYAMSEFTDEELAGLWKSLSQAEQSLVRFSYARSTGRDFTDTQLGHEYLRRRMQMLGRGGPLREQAEAMGLWNNISQRVIAMLERAIAAMRRIVRGGRDPLSLYVARLEANLKQVRSMPLKGREMPLMTVGPKAWRRMQGLPESYRTQVSVFRAIHKIQTGSHPEDVRRWLGWYKGPDGRWRFEIPTADAQMKWDSAHWEAVAPIPNADENDPHGYVPWTTLTKEQREMWDNQPSYRYRPQGGAAVRLGQIFDAPELMRLYPELRNMKVLRPTQAFPELLNIPPMLQSLMGGNLDDLFPGGRTEQNAEVVMFHPPGDAFVVRSGADGYEPAQLQAELLMAIQQVIQREEGFLAANDWQYVMGRAMSGFLAEFNQARAKKRLAPLTLADLSALEMATLYYQYKDQHPGTADQLKGELGGPVEQAALNRLLHLVSRAEVDELQNVLQAVRMRAAGKGDFALAEMRRQLHQRFEVAKQFFRQQHPSMSEEGVETLAGFAVGRDRMAYLAAEADYNSTAGVFQFLRQEREDAALRAGMSRAELRANTPRILLPHMQTAIRQFKTNILGHPPRVPVGALPAGDPNRPFWPMNLPQPPPPPAGPQRQLPLMARRRPGGEGTPELPLGQGGTVPPEERLTAEQAGALPPTPPPPAPPAVEMQQAARRMILEERYATFDRFSQGLPAGTNLRDAERLWEHAVWQTLTEATPDQLREMLRRNGLQRAFRGRDIAPAPTEAAAAPAQTIAQVQEETDYNRFRHRIRLLRDRRGALDTRNAAEAQARDQLTAELAQLQADAPEQAAQLRDQRRELELVQQRLAVEEAKLPPRPEGIIVAPEPRPMEGGSAERWQAQMRRREQQRQMRADPAQVRAWRAQMASPANRLQVALVERLRRSVATRRDAIRGLEQRREAIASLADQLDATATLEGYLNDPNPMVRGFVARMEQEGLRRPPAPEPPRTAPQVVTRYEAISALGERMLSRTERRAYDVNRQTLDVADIDWEDEVNAPLDPEEGGDVFLTPFNVEQLVNEFIYNRPRIDPAVGNRVSLELNRFRRAVQTQDRAGMWQAINALQAIVDSVSRASRQPPWKELTLREQESNLRDLSEALTSGGRLEGEVLSASRRLVALRDRRTGQVHIVSVYHQPRRKGTARVVAQPEKFMIRDPEARGGPKSRPYIPVEELMTKKAGVPGAGIQDRYQPLVSIFVRDPLRGFVRSFRDVAEFEAQFAREARAIYAARLAEQRRIGAVTPVLSEETAPPAYTEEGEAALPEGEVAPEEAYEVPEMARTTADVTEPDLRTVYEFFRGDENPTLEQVQASFETLTREARMDPYTRRPREFTPQERTVLTTLFRLGNILMEANRELSREAALSNVLDYLYEQISTEAGTEGLTRNAFVQTVLARFYPQIERGSGRGRPGAIPAQPAAAPAWVQNAANVRLRQQVLEQTREQYRLNEWLEHHALLNAPRPEEPGEGPEPLQPGRQVPLAAARRTYKVPLPNYSEWLVGRLRRVVSFGTPIVDAILASFQDIISRQKGHYGDLEIPAATNPYLEPAERADAQAAVEALGLRSPFRPLGLLSAARRAASRLNRATTWANKLNPIAGTGAAFVNGEAAMEGAIAVPAFAQQLFKLSRYINLAVGRLVEPVAATKTFVATGKWQRNLTMFGYDLIRRAAGKPWESWVEGTALLNGVRVDTVRAFFDRWKAILDQPGAGPSALEKMNQDFARKFPRAVTHVKTALGWEAVIHGNLASYIEGTAQRNTHMRAFREAYPATEAGRLNFQRDYRALMAKLPGETYQKDLDGLLRAMQGHATDSYAMLGFLAPDQPIGAFFRVWNNVLTGLASRMVLTGQMITQLPENFFGSTAQWLGYKNWLQSLIRIKQLYPELVTDGSINRAILDFSYDPANPIRSSFRIAGNVISRVFAEQLLNELQEIHAAAAAKYVADRIPSGQLSDWEQSRLPLMLKAMDFTPVEVTRLMAGDPDLIAQFERKAAGWLTGGNKSIAEGSRLGSNRLFNSIFRFHLYPMIKLNQFREAILNLIDAYRTGRNRKVATEQMARIVLGNFAQGAATTFLASFMFGWLSGLKIKWEEAKDDPVSFFIESWAATMSGPLYLLWRGVTARTGEGPVGWVKGISEQGARMIFPWAIMSEFMDMAGGSGAYRNLDWWQRLGRWVAQKMPGLKPAQVGLAIMGLSNDNIKLDNSIRAFYRWRRKYLGYEQGNDFIDYERKRRDFRRGMAQAVRALQEGDAEKLLAAIERAATDPDSKGMVSVADSFRARKLLVAPGPNRTPLDPDQLEALKAHIGSEAFERVQIYDLMMETMAEGSYALALGLSEETRR